MKVPVVAEREALRQTIRQYRSAGLSVGFVPTMGFLHQGHMTLIREAKKQTDRVVVSIFVNPTQFGPNEDFDRYPRDPEGDRAKIEEAGGDLIFMPQTETIYAPGHQTFVDVTEVTKGLCGEGRPGHFCGVATVVTKLFLLVLPDVAFFGEKDFQQLATIKQMVRDLYLDLKIVGVPTVREADGLALSSRNAYLSPEERQAALSLNRSLRHARTLFANKERDPLRLLQAVRDIVTAAPGAEVQYVQLCDSRFLKPLSRPADADDRVFLAVRFGKTRLIDNAPLAGDCGLS